MAQNVGGFGKQVQFEEYHSAWRDHTCLQMFSKILILDSRYVLHADSLLHSTGQADRTLVLLDVNLLNSSCEKPLYISPSSKQKLLGTITMDTDLLCSHNLMDYSLLLGIDRQKNELVLGIIDYIREFTWDKRMENVVKER